MLFQLHAPYVPKGDQPTAIEAMVKGVDGGERFQTLLGATGTGKTFSIANVIARTGRPTLVLAHNKTLAAQLCNELREFFPNNAVEYFISYYDYYQPEAYVPTSDTYIAKTASINEEIDMLRHSATRSLFERRDVIVVASISCIYGLGIPSEYLKAAVKFEVGDKLDLRHSLRDLVNNQYSRNDIEISRGRFRVRGDVLEIGPAYEDRLVRIELFGDEVEAIRYVDPTTGEILQSLETINIYPAKHFVTPKERLKGAIQAIRSELRERLDLLNGQGRLLEAQRLEQRTTYDLEMLEQVGYCNGVENYARHLSGREAGTPPECLIDYFPDDWLLVVDESHVTCSQLQAMYNGDQSRKQVLIEHGFRLPSAADNRPLRWEEFLERIGQTLYLSATPGAYEIAKSGTPVEQIIRPTGLIDPEVILKPTKGQIDDLLHEIGLRVERNERVLVTTLTKKMAEDLTDYLLDKGQRVRYLHSDIDTLRRIELLRELRMGEYDVLVGINLLREGLDLPEVSLVSILDADKEGFLRSARSLIQTIGRAARNVSGQVHMYADKVTPSMRQALDETDRRREIQVAYNRERGIDPTPLRKRIGDITEMLQREDADTEALLGSGRSQSRGKVTKNGGNSHGGRGAMAADVGVGSGRVESMASADLASLIQELTTQMHQAAAELRFELAARLRDELGDLKRELRQMQRATT